MGLKQTPLQAWVPPTRTQESQHSQTKDPDRDHDLLSLWNNADFISLWKWCSYLLGLSTIEVPFYFPSSLASATWQCFVGLLHLINAMLPSVCSWQIPLRSTALQGLWKPQDVWMDVTYRAAQFPRLPGGSPWTGECSAAGNQLSSPGTHWYQPGIQPKI